NYWVTVTDTNLCSTSASVTITEPTQLSTSIVSVQNPTCFGGTNGRIGVTATGGTGADRFLWSNGTNNQNLSGVGAGSYSVTVTDANACTLSSSASLNQPSPTTVTTNIQNVSCFAGSNGSVACVAGGGSGGYSYSWSNGTTTSGISNLTAGTYTLTVKDIANCTTAFTETINQPAAIVLTETHVNASCNSNNGSVNLNVAGGNPTYSYNWSNNDTIAHITGLAPGSYSVTVTDAHLCTAATNLSIIQSAGLTLNATHTDFACANKQG